MSSINDYEYAVHMIDRHPLLDRPAVGELAFYVEPTFAHVAAAADAELDAYLDGQGLGDDDLPVAA